MYWNIYKKRKRGQEEQRMKKRKRTRTRKYRADAELAAGGRWADGMIGSKRAQRHKWLTPLRLFLIQ